MMNDSFVLTLSNSVSTTLFSKFVTQYRQMKTDYFQRAVAHNRRGCSARWLPVGREAKIGIPVATGTGELLCNLTKYWKATFDGLASYPGRVAILLAYRYRNGI